MSAPKTSLLFVTTALCELAGCYLPYLVLREGRSIWLLVPAAASLAAFVWLLTLHPTAAGRVYAAYGGVYIAVALLWLWRIDGVRPQASDLLGAALCLAGAAVIVLGARSR
ncbi:MAG TPA: YnfA family protein [Solimonas sp.]